MSRHLLLLVLCAGGMLMGACDRTGPDWRDAAWYREADARIELLRKGDFRLRVVAADGRPVAGAMVIADLKRHRFLFGTCVNQNVLRQDATGDRYRAWVLQHCSGAVDENDMKWYSTEKKRGEFHYEAGDAIAAWCASHDLKLRGHCLFWSREKFIKFQPWLLDVAGEDLREAVEGRLTAAVTRYRGKVVCWDVNNEMLDGNFYESRLPGIRARMFARAHELDPVPLFVNEFGILGVDEKCGRYLAMIKDLQGQGAPVGGIGIQEHACERFTTARQAAGEQVGETAERVRHSAVSPEEALRDLDRLADFGLPIHLTEISCKTPDERARAIGLETLYRVGFSHPAVEAILVWGFWARSHWLGEDASLMDQHWNPTAAGRMLTTLLTETWHTRAEGDLTGDGFAFRGFHGDYVVTVRLPDNTEQRVEVAFDPETTEVEITLGR